MTSDLDRAVVPAFERRAARADLLARDAASSAGEPLRFAAGLYRAQGRLADAAQARTLTGRLADDGPGLERLMRDLLQFIKTAAPPELAAEAERRVEVDLGPRLEAFWQGEHDYLSRALLKPYVEVLAARALPPDRPRPHGEGGCPFCGSRPWIAARRSAEAESGAERALGCALCGRDRAYPRIRCPACGESDPARLPSFQSERHPTVRIEACESCHAYVKSLDLTLDARPIPEVDDLVSIAMDLWAAESGFKRLEPGLAGL